MPRKKEGRAAQGAGTIRQRANGSWEARFTVGRDPGTGKQIQKSIYGKTQGEVRMKLNAAITEVDEGTWTEPEKLNLAAWANIWIDEYTMDIKPNTVICYRKELNNHIIPALGKAHLQKLTPHQIQTFYNHMIKDKGLSPKTVKNVHGVLHRLLGQAMALGYIKSNPASLATIPKAERQPIHPLDRGEINVFLAAAKEDCFFNLYTVTLFTGLRLSEVVGLTWDCIDFDTGTIHIYRQLLKMKGGYDWGAPKNSKSRTITPAPAVMAILRTERTQQIENRLAAGSGWDNLEGFAFTNEIGAHCVHVTIRKHFKKIADAIGRPDLRFHDLRHTYAVASIQAGDDIKTVQENLGHHSAAFTMDTYAHV
ncbi:MAG: site-specific integrase, partial [Eubacterium sp.]